jgi:hypothetical protein
LYDKNSNIPKKFLKQKDLIRKSVEIRRDSSSGEMKNFIKKEFLDYFSEVIEDRNKFYRND